ncbi:hypothetical protein ODZ83_07170 [Acaricomes phytoseiuli]|uniref:hypothetical protein n=1 Tax=Acaricomes phytoseiuli TaxID=291968 RepID=UPI0022213C8E|nr:hypothetical protein [Acaricomes phytoseiuli]MCW1249966.1 hypothetical protein [Acaricomes phytoseiuli]
MEPPERQRPSSRTVRYVVRGARSIAGAAFGVATVAAFATLTPITANAAGASSASGSISTSVSQQVLGGATGASARLAGVQRDLARAVALGQVTTEQARRFEAKLNKRLSG